MPLKTRTTFPPGGFPFDQKKADGSVKKFDGLTYGFWPQVIRIKEYREGNGLMPTDKFAIADELDAFQCERLGFDPRWVESKKNPTFGAHQFSPSHLLRSAKHAAAGVNILKDWLGEGGVPVTPELAQARADVCLKGDQDKDGNPCKCRNNKEGHFFQKLTTAIAKAIHEQRREKLRLGMRVEGEEELHTCTVCDCHLPLKVHVPFKTIAERTSDVQWEEFPEFCWMNKERENATPQTTSA